MELRGEGCEAVGRAVVRLEREVLEFSGAQEYFIEAILLK